MIQTTGQLWKQTHPPLYSRDDFHTRKCRVQQRNIVLVGGTGTGKTHLAIAIARQAVRNGFRARFFNLVDLANQLEQEKLAGKGGRLADRLSRYTELVILDELGYLPFSKNESACRRSSIRMCHRQSEPDVVQRSCMRPRQYAQRHRCRCCLW